jgi:hypothetical protein
VLLTKLLKHSFIYTALVGVTNSTFLFWNWYWFIWNVSCQLQISLEDRYLHTGINTTLSVYFL